jgi:hypothetical protein
VFVLALDVHRYATRSSTITSIRTGNFVSWYSDSLVGMPPFKPSLRNADNVHVTILEEFSQAGICVSKLQSAITTLFNKFPFKPQPWRGQHYHHQSLERYTSIRPLVSGGLSQHNIDL